MNKDLLEERKQKIIELFQNELYVPMKLKEIAIFLQITKEKRDELSEVLDALMQEGKIQISGKGKYSLSEGEMLTGVFESHPNGFGFVTVEGYEEDFFVPAGKTNGAMHKDTVQVLLLNGSKGKRKEAEVKKIIDRGTTRVVGIFEKGKKGFGFVIADNAKISKDIFVPEERSRGAVDGHKVVVEITDYGNDGKKPEGKVVEIIGHINDPGVDIMSIVKGYDLPVEFPQKVMTQVERISGQVTENDRGWRMDLTAVPMVTIDGEDAKDLDDAVSVERDGENYKLGVHIADVTNYVQENSALDREALDRGTSVYLVDRVIPMLPHQLSNGICSLNQGEDRLALSCIMTINKKGIVIDHQIAETIINVDRRMTYTNVKKILEDKDEETIQEYEELVPMFQLMEEVASALREKRRKRGSIDFDFPETKMILDPNGHPIKIMPYDRNIATKIIEDFMLIANETVAQNYFWQEVPFLYRTHDTPDPEKIQKLATLIRNFGYSIKTSKEEIHPKELQKLLVSIEGTDEEPMISRLTLRSMKQARYTVTNSGHFGLACEYYSHFTSPIRRYPDLQIHRIIKESLRGKLKESRIEHYEKILPEVAKHSSEMERRAEEAERETNKLKKVEYMEDHIGETFTGVISGVTNWGIYVELPNTIEGMVHVSNMEGDYYKYCEDTYEMIGESTGKKYKLGQTLKVKVHGTDKIGRTIDFIFATEGE